MHRSHRWLPAALALAAVLALSAEAAASDVVIKEDESGGVKGLIATFAVDAPRDAVFETLNDLGGFKKIFPNVLEVKVVREQDNTRDVFFRVDAVLSEASYTLRRTHKRGKAVDIITWNRLSGDANVIRGSWALVDGPDGTTKVTYKSYVDVSAFVPTATVRSIAMSKVKEMVVRVRKASIKRGGDGRQGVGEMTDAPLSSQVMPWALAHRDKLYNTVTFRNVLLGFAVRFNVDATTSRERFDAVFEHLVREAELSVSLLDGLTLKGHRLLEVGGGVGLTYAFLLEQGLDVHALEPSDAGFDDYHTAGIALLGALSLSEEGWHDLPGERAPFLGISFDVIFSNNVLEHILTLEETLAGLEAALAPGGVMIHNTVNYNIPYEPHFGIPLVPLAPRLTAWLKPSLCGSALWQGLNFITTGELKRLSEALDLSIVFDRGVMMRTFQRLDHDAAFAQRQRRLVPIYNALKAMGLLPLLTRIPVSWTTPIRFTLRRRSDGTRPMSRQG